MFPLPPPHFSSNNNLPLLVSDNNNPPPSLPDGNNNNLSSSLSGDNDDLSLPLLPSLLTLLSSDNKGDQDKSSIEHEKPLIILNHMEHILT